MILPITLSVAGAAALINLWLAVRVGQVRTTEKVLIGDGGNENVIRRMRAHANFVEYTPFVLILIGAIELAQGTSTWLWAVSSLYLVGRLAHAFGMDGAGKARMVGTLVTMLSLLGLGIYALVVAHTSDTTTTVSPASAVTDSPVETVPEG